MKFIIFLSFIFILSSRLVFAGLDSIILMPEVEELLKLYNEVPQIFSESARYDLDIVKLVKEHLELEKKFNKGDQKKKYLSIKISGDKEFELIEATNLQFSLRGCVGGDCSSRESAMLFNDPYEKCFFIYDKYKNIKGYMTGVELELFTGEKAFYLRTISGSHLSKFDILLFIHALHHSLKYLGVEKLALPASEKYGSLLTFQNSREAFADFSKKSHYSQFKYLNSERRKLVEVSSFEFMNGDYEKMNNNLSGQVIESPPILSGIFHFEVMANNSSGIKKKKEISKEAMLEFLILLKRRDYLFTTKSIINSFFIDSHDRELIVDFLALFNPRAKYTTQQLEDELDRLFSFLNVKAPSPFFGSPIVPLEFYLNASDAKNALYKKRNLRALEAELKKGKNSYISNEILIRWKDEILSGPHFDSMKKRHPILEKIKACDISIAHFLDTL
jgi:hypothetical protein